MKKTIFVIWAILSFSAAVFGTEEWQQLKSDHFIIFYKSTPEDFAKKVADAAESYYNKIAEDLGFSRFNFWLWDNRAKIYIHDSAEDFRRSTGQPGWSGGYAVPAKKLIHTFPGAKDFFETVLAHEMGHIIFREFVGFNNPSVPTWLEEGVASFQEREKSEFSVEVVRQALAQGSFKNLGTLNGLRPLAMNNEKEINLFYAESISVVEYLINYFGREKFVYFCQNLRDKNNLQAAMSSAYPFENLDELSAAWQKSLGQ
jgi:hypothetical protein